MNTLLLKNGCQLAWNEYGAPAGEPLFYFHGIPGSQLEAGNADTIAKELGIRLISPGRPGNGDSDSLEAFSLIDWPKVVSQLADALSLDRFSILGFSGGGAFALACAHQIPERIKHMTLISSTAPYDTEVMQNNVNPAVKPLYDLSATDYDAAVELISQMVTSATALMDIMQAPLAEVDLKIFKQNEFYQHYLKNMTMTIHQGVNGIVSDLHCIAQPWQFNLEDIEIPVSLWHGHDDNNIGYTTAEYLADKLKNSSLYPQENSGHYFLFDKWLEVLTSVKQEIN